MNAEVISLRLTEADAANIAAILEALNDSAPAGITFTTSDAMRYAIEMQAARIRQEQAASVG